MTEQPGYHYQGSLIRISKYSQVQRTPGRDSLAMMALSDFDSVCGLGWGLDRGKKDTI